MIENTIVNSVKQICKLYDKDFHLYRNYKKVDWTEINTYNFTELELINKEMVLDYFDDYRFFDDLEFMDNAEEVIKKLSKEYQIIICSIGRKDNLMYKREWIKQHVPYAKFIPIDFSVCSDKSCINMENCIILDDNTDMLDSCNATVKLLFGDEYSWNKENKNNYQRYWNWIEVEKLLLV